MIIEGKFTVKAPIQKLWDTLFDVQALAACLPGTEEIKQIDDRDLRCNDEAESRYHQSHHERKTDAYQRLRRLTTLKWKAKRKI